YNSLDKRIFPNKGVRIDAEAGWVFRQNINVSVLRDGDPYPEAVSAISTQPYLRTSFSLESYYRVLRRLTAIASTQAGANFNYTNNIMNEFSVGGVLPLYNNQVTFIGLPEGSIYTPTVAAFMGGFRYEFLSNTYATAKANVLFTNLINKSVFFNNPDFMSGYGLSFGYNFALGPLEVGAMYSDRSGKIYSTVSFGVSF
ncbi:MAG: hypothetical protein J0I84_06325, partial [Terrimonas sp.]|nr:hypothetical protein [Terrimonas sp.]